MGCHKITHVHTKHSASIAEDASRRKFPKPLSPSLVHEPPHQNHLEILFKDRLQRLVNARGGLWSPSRVSSAHWSIRIPVPVLFSPLLPTHMPQGIIAPFKTGRNQIEGGSWLVWDHEVRSGKEPPGLSHWFPVNLAVNGRLPQLD